ncbi:MAG: glycosyl transferase [Firmicutes bacterium HGW-Firmicutes-1]|jgi:penicillin-binding protein 1A|nr:MAG: glycosyl transferase [Firmicutes bacterium HGW-Firmicutes-1]
MNFEKKSTKKKQEAINSAPKKRNKKVGVTLIKVFAFSILLIGIIGIATGLGIVKAIIDSAPPLDLDDVNPEGYATMIYNQEGLEVQKLHGDDANRIYAQLDQIPKHMQDAVVAIEDERFWNHNGIDIQGIFRAIYRNIKSGDITGSGASTLTQQIIKNNVLSTEKKFERKIQEQYLAIQLEKEIDKKQILELYLNTSPFGRGTLGVQAAANAYFNKDISQLTIAEAATIAAITQRPTYYDPVVNPENNKDRQRIVLKKMLEQNYISQAQYDTALAEEVYAHIQIINQDIGLQSDYSYFVDEVIREVLEDLKVQKGYSESEAFNLIYRGGLSIYMTQDLAMQAIVDEVYTKEDYFPPASEMYAVRVMYTVSVLMSDGTTKHHYDESEFSTKEKADAHIETLKAEWAKEGDEIIAEKSLFIPQPQSAMVIMDYHNGHVKAIAGGRGEKIGNQTFNRATQAKRQPGSTFKIVAAYLPAIDTMGYTLGTAIDDVPFTVSTGGGSYSPKNWYNHQAFNYRGLTPLRTAIKDSMNICAVKTLYDIGPQTGFDYLINLGFTTLVDTELVDGKTFTDKNLALALGGITHGVTPLELTAAYGAIANNGVYIEPVFYTKVLNHKGEILLEKEPITRTVMKETTSFLLTSAMQSVITGGTGTLANFKSMPIAGKTGTTQDDVDLLLTAYTPYYVATVWMGYDQPKTMNYSFSYHSVIWRDVMQRIHEDLPYKDFPRPSGIVSASICTESGKLAVGGLCDHDPRGSTIVSEYFASGTVPTESCDVHIKATICESSGLFATEYCPADTKKEKIFIQRPEPLVPANWDSRNPPRIADHQYELPDSMVGEYCNIHGPAFEVPVVELPSETDFDPLDFPENEESEE